MRAFYVITLLSCVILSYETASNKRLLIILLDGFRTEYLNHTSKNGGFQSLIREGVTTEYVIPDYPSESYPGYYSIATGLWGENNGIPLNVLYDPKTKSILQTLPDENSEKPFWWEKAEPLWVSTTKHKIETASLRWPGANIPNHGIKPKIATAYKTILGYPLNGDIDKVLDWFESNEIQYAQIYSQFSDVWGHLLGPEIFKYLIRFTLDKTLKSLMKKIKKKNLQDSLNVVVISDHGMTRTDRFAVKTVKLDDYLNPNDFEALLIQGVWAAVVPLPGKKEKIFNDLKNMGSGFHVYWKKDLPERYHIKHSDRVPEIFLQAKRGYFLDGIKNVTKQFPHDAKTRYWTGFHGYDSRDFPDMHGIFIGWGPDFQKGKKFPPIRLVDPYNLFTRLINVPTRPNNGTWSKVKDMLV